MGAGIVVCYHALCGDVVRRFGCIGTGGWLPGTATWILVSMHNERDGKKTEPYGPNPRGVQIFTPDGRFYAITMRASLPKFASDNRLKGTAEEYKAVVQGSMAYYGTYKVVNEKEHLVNLHVETNTHSTTSCCLWRGALDDSR